MANLDLDDVDLDRKWVRVLGKGRRPRAVPFGAASAKAVDRYLRVRGGHARADFRRLWLGSSGRTFTDGAVRQMLERRGAEAGVANLHAHRFRHTFAHQHLAEGGNEGDLMMFTGWKSRQMLQRYASSTAAERAKAAYRSPLDRMNERGAKDQLAVLRDRLRLTRKKIVASSAGPSGRLLALARSRRRYRDISF